MGKWIGDRVSIVDNENITTIVILPKKHRIKELLLFLWVLGFTFVGLFMMYLLIFGLDDLAISTDDIEGVKDKQKIYLVVFLGFWVYFEYKTVKALLWYKFGKELLKIDEVALSVKKSIFGYGKAHRYFFENIKNFSQVKEDNTSFNQFFENAFWTIGTDSLVFEYFGKTKSIGRRLDEKSAKLLLRLIDDRVKKQLKKKS